MATKLLNSAMMPGAGRYHMVELSKEEFVRQLQAGPFESFIGYPDTAAFLERISGVSVPVNRGQTALEDGDVMLIVRLKYRVTSPGDKGKFTPTDEDYEFYRAEYSV